MEKIAWTSRNSYCYKHGGKRPSWMPPRTCSAMTNSLHCSGSTAKTIFVSNLRVDPFVKQRPREIFHACSRMTSRALLSVRSPRKAGCPHLAFARPLSELYLAHELGNKPRGRSLVLHFLVEGLLIGAQRLHRSIERLERCLVEAGADMPRIDSVLLRFVSYCKHQGAKVLSRSARRSVTDDHDLLLMHSL